MEYLRLSAHTPLHKLCTGDRLNFGMAAEQAKAERRRNGEAAAKEKEAEREKKIV